MIRSAPIALTVGEPGGVGPELCLRVLGKNRPAESPRRVLIGDRDLLKNRAESLGIPFAFSDYESVVSDVESAADSIWHCAAAEKIAPGNLSAKNAPHILEQLTRAGKGALDGRFSAVVTSPIHKATMIRGLGEFAGQTEFFAELAGVSRGVMLLANSKMRVALATTHLPLAKVAESISAESIAEILRILDSGLRRYFYSNSADELKTQSIGARFPKILVAGLNPHAGEEGFLGDEESAIISPAIAVARKQGVNAAGPFSADTIFTAESDCVLAMFHDQGLPVIKYAEFHRAINATLGLPFLRVAPGHGVALDLAGGGGASDSALSAAIELAEKAENARAEKN